MKRIASLTIVVLFAAILSSAQGRADKPKRLQPGSGAVVLSGVLRAAQEHTYVFTSEKGRTASFRNPSPSLFDVRVYEPGSGFDTEYDSSRSFEVELPESAEYEIHIRRKMGGPRTARFRISLSFR